MTGPLKHTPGPWHLSNHAANGEDSITVSRSRDLGGHSVVLVESSRRADVLLADARLIAAAPELLEALEALIVIVRQYADQSATQDGLTNCRIIGKANAALHKARGDIG